MESAIGRRAAKTSPTQHRTEALASLAIALGMTCALRLQRHDVRLAIAVIAFVGFVILLDGDVKALGLRLQPAQDWKK